MRARLVGIVAGVALASGQAWAGVMPVSYDMINGNSGTYTYFDETYNVGGNALVANAALSGGLGDLTDGLGKTTDNWNNPTDAPVWVGWAQYLLGNTPRTVTFDFGASTLLGDVTIWSLNGGVQGGVGHAGIRHFQDALWEHSDDGVLWTTWGNTAPTASQLAFAGVSAIPLNAGPVTARYARLTMQNDPATTGWLFISEVEFTEGAQVIPLPHAGGMALAGLGVLAMRRRRVMA